MKQKVYAYVLKQNRLLVFRHTQFPEAGIQVPGGTVEPSEPLEHAVLREAAEETGLQGLRIIAYLGSQVIHLDGIPTQRHFYHLGLDGEVLETWLSYELTPSDGGPASIEFEFFWVSFPDDVPDLAGDQGSLLKAVRIL